MFPFRYNRDMFESIPQTRDSADEGACLEIRRAADRVSALILYSDLPLIDIRLAAAGVRRICQHHFPERSGLYERLYAARFRRLWEQWRGGEAWR
jgi:hypothetical protein